GKFLPLARAETEREAGIVRQRLSEAGVETLLLSDEKLAAEDPPRRLRGLEFSGDKLLLKIFNTDEAAQLKREDLVLIVTGAIFQKRVEATEKHSKKGENILLDATETASDEVLIDIYGRDDETG